ncbi:hypothetical protein FH972_025109 [Carpinus fangiana]|uniref:NmrA-like domain-containing protein n=1 Tax=Carpinus fangiana TaxID=176857 RepID=A0A5N6L080_9ROSI|nr:hypothetical protein FH972_025109 [Carpinus fangiana]
MTTVALAGASTGLGHQILQALLDTKKHNVVVLSRGPSPDLAALGANVKTVDYNDQASLVAALSGVHTVISAIGGMAGTGTGIREGQLALVAAAHKAGVSRFAPSEFAVVSSDFCDLYKPKIEVLDAIKATGMGYTRYCCGLFLNIMGSGTPKGQEEALGGLRPWNFVINMKAGTADVPGDGTDPISLTTTRDIGRFVAASLDLETWPELTLFEGDRKSFRDLVALAEEVQGRKFLVKENSISEMKQASEKAPETTFYNDTRIHFAEGGGVTGRELNDLFPDLKPTSAKEYVEHWWSGVKLGEPQWEENRMFN